VAAVRVRIRVRNTDEVSVVDFRFVMSQTNEEEDFLALFGDPLADGSVERSVENRYYFNPEHRIRITYLLIWKHSDGSRGHDLEWLGDAHKGKLHEGE